MPRPDYSHLEDRAKEAESLLGHRIFIDAMLQLHAKYVAQLVLLPINDPKIFEMHARLKLLDEVTGALRAIIAEFKMVKHE